jgi:hypothetical protein
VSNPDPQFNVFTARPEAEGPESPERPETAKPSGLREGSPETRRATAKASDLLEVVTLVLTDEQRRWLEPLVRRQAQDRRGLLFVSVAPFWSVEAGQTRLRLQAKFLPWARARRALKVMQETEVPSSTKA